MLNHMIAWRGWIFPSPAPKNHLSGPTRSEFATFERMVLKAPPVRLVPKVHEAKKPAKPH